MPVNWHAGQIIPVLAQKQTPLVSKMILVLVELLLVLEEISSQDT